MPSVLTHFGRYQIKYWSSIPSPKEVCVFHRKAAFYVWWFFPFFYFIPSYITSVFLYKVNMLKWLELKWQRNTEVCVFHTYVLCVHSWWMTLLFPACWFAPCGVLSRLPAIKMALNANEFQQHFEGWNRLKTEMMDDIRRMMYECIVS